MTTAALSPGFADPPLQAQSVFRLVLDAMAHPGRIKTLAGDAPSAPAPLDDATFALALTLIDFETKVWLDDRLAMPDVVESLRFHCGCPIVEQPGAAAFALIGQCTSMAPFSDFARGTPEYPDRAATLIVQTHGMADDQGWTLTGPGIQSQARFRALGLPADFAERWSVNRGGFPNGVDLIFTHGRQFACLPRTTALEG
ncbi:MAG: phosphonate C-P lyase system protein PhnH [Pseudomonadota bacterium]